MSSLYGSTPWRRLLYKRLSTIVLEGKVIDLGGSKKSGYHGFFPHAHIEVANTDASYGRDLSFSLEESFPLGDASYDGALCINTLEHIYEYQGLLSETRRVLRPEAPAVFAVPFLLQVHPCPHDHWRFTQETLERVFTDAGFSSVVVETIAPGPCTAACQLIYNALGFALLREVVYYKARALDLLFARLSKRYRNSAADYALGFLVIAEA
jgi:hypothetical protein